MSNEEIGDEMKNFLIKYFRDVLLLVVIGLGSWSLITTINIQQHQSISETNILNMMVQIQENKEDIRKIKDSRYTANDALKDHNLIISQQNSQLTIFNLKMDHIQRDILDIKAKIK